MAKNGKPYRGRQGGYPRHYNNNNNNNNNNNDNKPSGVPKSISDISPFIIQASSGTSFNDTCDKMASFIGGQPYPQSARASRLLRTLADIEPPAPAAPIRVTEATFVPIKDEDGSPTKPRVWYSGWWL